MFEYELPIAVVTLEKNSCQPVLFWRSKWLLMFVCPGMFAALPLLETAMAWSLMTTKKLFRIKAWTLCGVQA